MNWQQTTETILSTLESWQTAFLQGLPNAVAAIAVVVIGWLVARVARKGASAVMERMDVVPSVRNLLATFVFIVVQLGGVIIALGILNLQSTVTSLLAGAGVIGLALGLAFQDIAQNLLAGVSMSFRRPFAIGDLIETNDVLGHVRAVDLRTTHIETLDGQQVLIPNHDIYTSPMTNYTGQSFQRVTVEVGVSYADDLGHVEQVTREVLENLDRDDDRPVQVFFTGFGGSSIDLIARFWIQSGERSRFLDARSKAIRAIKDRFDAEEISIPFPIRTVDFGIEGGQTLAEMLPSELAA